MTGTDLPAAGSGVAAYRDVLRLPHVRTITGLALVSRIPATAVTVTLTLHVVLTLGHGFAAAGLVSAAITTGMAVGAPLTGLLVDRRGLRIMVAVACPVSAAFWAVAPLLDYGWLLGGAFVAGMFGLPVFSLYRQLLAAAVPDGRRRPAFAMDSMSVELSYIAGPGLGSLLTLTLGSVVTMRVIGAGYLLAGLVLLVRDPPTSGPRTGPDSAAPPLREWLTAPLAGSLLAITAAVLAIVGTELAFIASLTRDGQAWSIAVVNAVWCAASIVGGFVYGAARRPVGQPLMLAVLGVTTLPVALGGPWWSFALLVVAGGLFTAPTIAAGSDAIASLTDDRVRGVASGLQGSASTAGSAIATPLAGALIDHVSPAAAALASGAAALMVAGVCALLLRRGTVTGRRGPAVRRSRRTGT